MLSIKRVTTLTTHKFLVNALQRNKTFSIDGLQNDNSEFCTCVTKNLKNYYFSRHACKQTVNLLQKQTFCTEPLPKNPNVFGTLGDRKFDAVEMDEVEKKEEEFVMNEARIPRRLKPSAGQYVDMIEERIKQGDLKGAMAVLDLIKKNRDKPNEYMYSLLIRAFAIQGNLKKCINLFTTMKKRNLKIKAATYVSMLNACANSGDKETSLEQLNSIRRKLLETNFPMNEALYNVLIKAYGQNNKLGEALQLADEMIDKQMPIEVSTFNSLMYGAISDKVSGLRHCLTIWHMMRLQNVNPDILSYNLMLRAMRDTQLGELRVDDILLPGIERSRVTLTDGPRPDLLSVPPSFCSIPLLPISIQKDISNEIDKSRDSDNKLGQPSELSTSIKEIGLKEIQADNKLILFGGFEGILNRMENDNVKPNVRTMTYLINLVPNSESAEKSVIKYAKQNNIALDIDFYNMLIKKRCFRRDYDGARAVMHQIQRSNLMPDIITWGVMALTCRNVNESRELISAMKSSGHSLNNIIVGTLINNATKNLKFGFILELMEIMVEMRMEPNKYIIEKLDDFQTRMSKLIQIQDRMTTTPKFKVNFSKFNLRYSTWKKKSNRESVIYRSYADQEEK